VIFVILKYHKGQNTVRFVKNVLKALTIIAHGFRIVLEKETDEYFSVL
jgi:hypothetical protein